MCLFLVHLYINQSSDASSITGIHWSLVIWVGFKGLNISLYFFFPLFFAFECSICQSWKYSQVLKATVKCH